MLDLKRIIVQDTNPSSAAGCFSYTKSLQKIILKDGITSLPANMFSSNDALRYIRVPSTVTSLSTNALNCGNQLRFVRFESINPPSLASSLTVPVNQGIIIPYDSVTSYMTKTNYPSASKYRIGFGTFNIGETLPSQSTDGNYNIT